MPEPFERGLRARSLASLLAAGGALGSIALLFSRDEALDEARLLALAAVALAIAAVEFLRAARAGAVELHLALAAGTVLLTLANHEIGGGSLYPILYAWAILYAFYFFPLAQALAQLAFAGACYAALLAVQAPVNPVTRWLVVIAAPAVAGLMIARLLRRLSAQAYAASERARALRESEARTRAIVSAAPEAFITIDRDGLVTAWNAAAEQLFGWDAAEAVGRPLRSLIVPPGARDAFDRRRDRMLASTEPVSGRALEVELQRRDGRTFPAEASMSRVTIGQESYLSGFVRDLSERRRREQERDALLREQAARAEAERVAEIVSGTQELVDAALTHGSLETMLGDVVARVRSVLRADAVSLFLAEEGGRLGLGASTAAGLGESAASPLGHRFAARVAAAGVPRLEPEPRPEDFVDRAGGGVDSAIGVPLRRERDVTGVLVVTAREPRRLTAEDLTLLRVAADRVALAIGQVRIYEREHRIAETLQRSLLPDRLPQLPGLAVAARYEPAADEAEVGGDWYDVIPLPDGGVGLVMGDVAGKGLAAASMVGRLRSALRAYVLEGHGPAAAVERLNRLVCAELEESQMATLVFLVLEAGGERLRWVNAGHLPPLVVAPGAEPRYLEGERSPPLGVLPFAGFRDAATTLGPGGTVLLYTDGLVERAGEHIDLGLARLSGVVAAGPASADGLLESVVRELVPPEGAGDDVALLALSSVAASDELRLELASEPEALAALRGALRRWLAHAGAAAGELADITTACGEAATNAIEHGAAGDAPFRLEARLSGREVLVVVSDRGSWRAPRDGDQGRGLAIMRALMDDVELTREPSGTTVRLRRALRRGNGAQG